MTKTNSRPPQSRRAPEQSSMWSSFRRSRSTVLRNAIVEKYMPLVNTICAKLATELPANVRFEDLVSAGTCGLMDAIEKYDHRRNTSFETYCNWRIRGAVLDELRSLNWIPRAQHNRSVKIGTAVRDLRSELGRLPTPVEIARKTGLNVRQVNTAKTERKQYLFGHAGAENPDAVAVAENFEGKMTHDPAALVEEKECRDILAAEIKQLGKAERLLVMLYYYEELTMRQIGEILSVTESRVCQMHSEILARLQQRLREFHEERC